MEVAQKNEFSGCGCATKAVGLPLQTARELQFGDGRGTWAADFEIVDQLIFGKRCGAETV